MTRFLYVWVLLNAGHALCDYPLQGDFLARGKNHVSPIPGVPWQPCLWAHAMIHAGMVLLVTHSTTLATLELFLHAWTDWSKNAGLFGRNAEQAFDIDQAIHFGCKLIWAILAVWVVKL